MTTREKLTALASNLWWSWHPELRDLFERLNPDAFARGTNNPHDALTLADTDVLADDDFAASVDAWYERFMDYLAAPSSVPDAPTTAYFCMEYGLHESIPLYSGGLGVLAGDHAKAASDLGLPFTGVGLLLRDGYFKQHFDASGWQQATYPSLTPHEHPLTLVMDDEDRPVTVSVPIGSQTLHLLAWKLPLGRINLYLFDSDFAANPKSLRGLTRRLYQGGSETRIQQEIILGIGGVRLLRALGMAPEVYHLNEGHCAFLLLELMREQMQQGKSRHDAEAWVREHCVFTTHTPVMAGHDRFTPDLFAEQMTGFAGQLGMGLHDMLAYGRVNPQDGTESFTMTVLGLKLARHNNGVSKLNGEVARAQWHHLYPGRSLDEVPIGHVTNGVHLPTWTAEPARDFLTEHLGDWFEGYSQPSYWSGIEDVPAADLWAFRSKMRARLINYIGEKVKGQTLPQHPDLDPEALTFGFARRFATYKRAPLLFKDLAKAAELFNDADRPFQVIYAGKAHPADEGGKRFIQEIYEMTSHPSFKGKLIFLENYDMEIGRMMTSGCDVWLNNPRRPYEASGTSGQKVASHGGLNVSILDGWWPEGYDETNGWAIGHEAGSDYKDPQIQDKEDAHFLYDVVKNSVIPTFYDRDENGIPTKWVEMMRSAMKTLPYAFSAHRMVSDYVEQIYKK
jgi:starch phosphorylase/maltose phosphorylase